MKKRVFSGIRATGRLHLGNYLGAVKGMLALQDDPEYETFYGVVDLHAMTTPYDKENLAKQANEVILDYLACGLDPKKSAVFKQSQLADLYTELMFYLSTTSTVARMQHLPTYKDKVKQHPQNVTMALLNYPILMAADILAYKAEKVPVGVDQEPHLEVAREIARKMNSAYGLDFPEPTRFAPEASYRSIPSLTGEGKMSKSIPNSAIDLTDDLTTIKEKLAAVPTDIGKGKIKEEQYFSENESKSSGVAALIEFVEIFQGKEKRHEYEQQYTTSGIRYSALKQELAGAIHKELQPIQENRKELKKDMDYVRKILRDGASRAREVAAKTLADVRTAMGLQPLK